MSTPVTRNFIHQNPVTTASLTQIDSASVQPAGVPKMVQHDEPLESSNDLHCLPEDVRPRIFAHTGQSIFDIGRTCKYWNVQVRNFVSRTPAGRGILREKNEAEFRFIHRMSVINTYRDLLSCSFPTFGDFKNNIVKTQCIETLRTYADPVKIVSPSKGHWLSADIESALATRSQKLTVFEALLFDDESISSLIGAINAIPPSGFAVLIISSQLLFSSHAARVWDSIARHPVVARLEISGDNTLSVGEQVVECVSQLPSKNMMISSFVLSCCRFCELGAEKLSELFGAATGISELEVFDYEIRSENVMQISEVVSARNAGAGSKLTLYVEANNLQQKFDANQRTELVNKGIHIRDSGQFWSIPRDPVQQALVQAVPAVEEESSADDSSSIVGDPS